MLNTSPNIKRIMIIFVIGLVAAIISAVMVYILFDRGIVLMNYPSEEKYPIRGVDVSNYQGRIDWALLVDQDVSFAFIKATEGSTFVDASFSQNWEAAQKTDLRVGAYHFFSYDSPGITQAENFIRVVTPFDGMLPPVVDVEFYGDKESNPPEKEAVTNELKAMLIELETHYGLRPIIYATKVTYHLYIEDKFFDYPLWIREVWYSPDECGDYDWTFWQYTNREKIPGYSGDEKFIDMNVFYGTREEFYGNAWKIETKFGNIFFRLRYIEMFGTGIRRIKYAYADSIIKPEFSIFENSIKVILPIIQNSPEILTSDDQVVFSFLSDGLPKSRIEIEGIVNVSKDKIIRVLNRLIEKNVIEKTGVGRGTKYCIR